VLRVFWTKARTVSNANGTATLWDDGRAIAERTISVNLRNTRSETSASWSIAFASVPRVTRAEGTSSGDTGIQDAEAQIIAIQSAAGAAKLRTGSASASHTRAQGVIGIGSWY